MTVCLTFMCPPSVRKKMFDYQFMMKVLAVIEHNIETNTICKFHRTPIEIAGNIYFQIFFNRFS